VPVQFFGKEGIVSKNGARKQNPLSNAGKMFAQLTAPP